MTAGATISAMVPTISVQRADMVVVLFNGYVELKMVTFLPTTAVVMEVPCVLDL